MKFLLPGHSLLKSPSRSGLRLKKQPDLVCDFSQNPWSCSRFVVHNDDSTPKQCSFKNQFIDAHFTKFTTFFSFHFWVLFLTFILKSSVRLFWVCWENFVSKAELEFSLEYFVAWIWWDQCCSFSLWFLLYVIESVLDLIFAFSWHGGNGSGGWCCCWRWWMVPPSEAVEWSPEISRRRRYGLWSGNLVRRVYNKLA